ncbi:MAG TPA: homoserine dehydrogenase, partial [Candidatus Limnocylindrales bacterium]|nr:homoserine dehydrogenase [Candidatus Limnocylindrales bacterium]
MNRAPLRVAVLGAGTVGREVVRGLLEHADRLCATDGAPLVLTGVACRDLTRARRAGIPGELLTDAPAHLVAGPDTDVVVELMGGDEPARTLIAAALGAGKPVVTANKHVVAHHGPALEAAARRAGVAFRFEAAVAGGIPVLGVLASELAANEVTRVRGIVNGTTNYILSAMARDGRPYADVLADAQQRGYAEADPAGDVEGDDAVNKLVILTRLAFGRWLDPGSVLRHPPTVRGWGRPGIVGVADAELDAAARFGLTLKLLAEARQADGIPIAAVLPTAVPADGPLGRTDGVTNCVEIEATPLGALAMAGPGAGGAATCSAVLGDLVAVARGLASTWAGRPPAVDPAAPAGEPLLRPRSWLAFVPRAVLASGATNSASRSVAQ